MGTLEFTPTQPTWIDGPGGGTAVDAADLNAYNQAHLMNNNTRIELTWNGTTYVLPKHTPTGEYAVNVLTDTSRLRDFLGPVAPWTLTGVIMSNYDRWVPIS